MALKTQDNQIKKTQAKPIDTQASSSVATKSSSAKPAKTESRVINEVKASARFIKIAPAKVRLVINQLRGQAAESAMNNLRFINKVSAKPVAKLIASAIANAEHNFSLDKQDLYIKTITANDGPVLKRFKPRAHGRAAMIREKSTHIDLILGLRPGAKPGISKSVVVDKPKADSSQVPTDEVKVMDPTEVKREPAKIPGQNQGTKGKDEKGFLQKVFNRKVG